MPKFNKNFDPRKTIFPVDETEETPVESEVVEVPVTRYKVTADKLNVRQQPNPNATIVEVIDKGFEFTGTPEGDWVKLSEGKYVMKMFVE